MRSSFSDSPDPTSAQSVGTLPSCPVVTPLPFVTVSGIVAGVTVPGPVIITVVTETASTCTPLLSPRGSSQQAAPQPGAHPSLAAVSGEGRSRLPQSPACFCLSHYLGMVVLSRASGNPRKQRFYLWQCQRAKCLL